MTKEMSNELPTEYQNFIGLSRYARWREADKRRETWSETVQRYMNFFSDRASLSAKDDMMLQDAITNLEVMPSMRALMTAGEALDRDNVAGFNCAFLNMDRQRSFDELMYVLMCGTGVGFSVEAEVVAKLPVIAEDFHESETTIVVRDSKIGWATAYKELITLLYSGNVPKWDVSKVRPAGAVLKTFGGRASGAEPLEDLFKFTVNTMRRFAGSQLPAIAVHDLVCKVAEIVVVGGVRRSALISLSSLDDDLMRVAKSPIKVIEYTLLGHTDDASKRKYSVTVNDEPYGERSKIVELDDWGSEQLQKDHTVHWSLVHPERALANNSIAYTEKPTVTTFMREGLALYESYSGERGSFNREAAKSLCPDRRDTSYAFGTNPCSEIVLRDRQFCNLSEVVVRSTDTLEDLKHKVKVATILGTLQSTLTNFRYLSSAWQKNTEEEALLGVSLTGIMDHPVLNGSTQYEAADTKYIAAFGDCNTLAEILEELKEIAVETNKEWAKKLGVNVSASVTCVKPSGTVSQLVDSASGIHPRYSPFYVRTVRADNKDPLAKFMTEVGFPVEPDIMKPTTGSIFSFPMKAPEGSVFRDDRSAVQQLEMWKTYQLHWCEHKPSVTIYYKEDEYMDVLAWQWDNFNIISGISLLPHDGGSYKQAPYQEITEEEYDTLLAAMPQDVDWARVGEYEAEDNTTSSQTLACSGSSCEIVDLT